MISKLFKKIFKINKTAKVAAILIFATTILSIMNLIVCRREHLEEVKNFLQVNFHISFLEDKDASGSLSKKGYELYPEWNCEIYALNDEKVIYYPEALYIPVSGTYDIPGFEYGYMEYKGNNKERIKMIKKTCLWFKKYREYKGLDYLSFHKRVYYSLDEAVHNDPNIDMVIDSGNDIKEILEPEIPKPEMTLKDVSIFGPYNILITKKANKRQRLIGLRINSDIPDGGTYDILCKDLL